MGDKRFKQFTLPEVELDFSTVGGFVDSGHSLSSGSMELVSGGTNSARLVIGKGNNSAGINSANDGDDIAFFAGKTYLAKTTAPFRVKADGSLVATSATITGAITAITGAIGGFNIGTDYLRDVANSMGLASTVTGGDDVRFWAGDTFANRATAPFKITEAGALTATSATITGAITISSGSGIANLSDAGLLAVEDTVTPALANIALQGWEYAGTFSSTDADTVAWTEAVLKTADGTSYSITAGNTGNMTAPTYIYLDIGSSTTAFQTSTTATNAVGAGKILVAVAENNTSSDATFQVFGGTGGAVFKTENIATNSVTANEINAATITGAEISASAIIKAGTGNNVGVLDGNDATYRIYAGHATPTSAPFRVTQAGRTITKDITIGNRMVTASTIAEVNAGITTLSAGGVLHLAGGSYTLNQNITVPNKTLIKGNSRDGVLLNMGAYKFIIAGTNVYTTGTITSIGSGGTAVVGSGTTWTNLDTTYQIFINERWYKIASIIDATHLILSEPYKDAATFAGTYRAVKVAADVRLENAVITGASSMAIDIDDCRDIQLRNILLLANNKGFTLNNYSFVDLDIMTINKSTSNGWEATNGQFFNARSFGSFANGGHGGVMNNTIRGGFSLCAMSGNTGDGLNCTNTDYYDFKVACIGNGGQGMEFVSGCDKNLIDGQLIGNTSDGFKLTTTSDQNRIMGIAQGNGAYGINIGNANCDNNVILAPLGGGNTSGDVSDSGTSTVRIQEGDNTGIYDSFTAGQALSANDPVFLENSSGFDVSVLDATSQTYNQSVDIGKVTTNASGGEKSAQTIQEGSSINVDKVKVRLQKTGTPTDNLVFALQVDSSGSPSGTNLATATIAGGSLTTSFVDYTLTFSSQVTLTANTKYWLIASRSSSLSDANYFALYGHSHVGTGGAGSDNYANGDCYVYNGSAWNSGNDTPYCDDFKWIFYDTSESGKVYKTKANVTGRYEAFIGFVEGATAKEGTATIRMSGILAGFTGLTVGSRYYLSDTEGAIATSAGSNTRKVGIATSATKLMITNIW